MTEQNEQMLEQYGEDTPSLTVDISDEALEAAGGNGLVQAPTFTCRPLPC